MRRTIFFAVMLSLAAGVAFAQNPKAPAGCNDVKVHNKLVALNKDLERQKYKLVLFTTDNIPSKTYVPITVKLEKGVNYTINFVASSTATKYELRMGAQHKKEFFKVKAKAEKTAKDEKDNKNTIIKNFTAPETGDYIIVISQQTDANECAGLSVMKK